MARTKSIPEATSESLSVEWFVTSPAPPKAAVPSASISTTTVKFNASAAELLGQPEKIAIGIAEIGGKKKVVAQKYNSKKHGDGYPVKAGKDGQSMSVKCPKFIALRLVEDLGAPITSKKRLKAKVSVYEDLLVLDF